VRLAAGLPVGQRELMSMVSKSMSTSNVWMVVRRLLLKMEREEDFYVEQMVPEVI